MIIINTMILTGLSALFFLHFAREEESAETGDKEDRDKSVQSLRAKMQALEEKINQTLQEVSDQKDKSSRKLKRKIEKRKLELQKTRLELEEKLENMKDSSERLWNRTKQRMLDNWEKLDQKVKKLLN